MCANRLLWAAPIGFLVTPQSASRCFRRATDYSPVLKKVDHGFLQRRVLTALADTMSSW